MSTLFIRLLEVENRFEEISQMLSQPEIIQDRTLFQRYSKEHKELTQVVATFRAYKKVLEEIEGSKELLNATEEGDLYEMAIEELKTLQKDQESLEAELQILLLPKDPLDSKNVILEIRAGAGGDEAGIFVGDLIRMYLRYAETRGWKSELLSSSDASTGGYKEIIVMINGDGAYSRLKYEAGVHRVQRVPVTESQGRIHTSTVTVAVLPEAEDVEIEVLEKNRCLSSRWARWSKR
jgi:peptide chain release factor 1